MIQSSLQIFAKLIILIPLIDESASYRSAATIKDQLQKHKIVPDFLPIAPEYDIEAVFANGQIANFGNTLAVTTARKEPTVEWTADDTSYYTLVLSDIDSPNPQLPRIREWQHWLVVNIPGSNVSKGYTYSKYIGPGSKKGNGIPAHRYLFSVFKQPGNKTMKFSEPHLDEKTMISRDWFSTHAFKNKYNLSEPYAVNFFQSNC